MTNLKWLLSYDFSESACFVRNCLKNQREFVETIVTAHTRAGCNELGEHSFNEERKKLYFLHLSSFLGFNITIRRADGEILGKEGRFGAKMTSRGLPFNLNYLVAPQLSDRLPHCLLFSALWGFCSQHTSALCPACRREACLSYLFKRKPRFLYHCLTAEAETLGEKNPESLVINLWKLAVLRVNHPGIPLPGRH